MTTQRIHMSLVASTAVAAFAIGVPAIADDKRAATTEADKVLSSWPPGPQLAGREMIAKYGPPQEVTFERMIWRDAGPYKRIMLTKEMLPHDFPLPHMDYLEHTILYNVPNDKTDEVHAFDASMTIYRVGGELSARCDLESNNVLTFNLANDVVTGKTTVAEARKQFGDLVMQRTLGKEPAYTSALQFRPQGQTAAADPEATTIPGSPKRVESGIAASGGDAEILGMLIALDLDEVHAATTATMKKPRGPVLDYAKMLHRHHGKHVEDTAKLGQKLRVTPAQTPAVRALHDKHAGALAKLVPLEGEAFSRGFLALMVAGHTEALQMIDAQLEAARHAEVKAHLTRTREAIASHLQQAKRLQGDREPRTSSR